jgi:hypothetical protein
MKRVLIACLPVALAFNLAAAIAACVQRPELWLKLLNAFNVGALGMVAFYLLTKEKSR